MSVACPIMRPSVLPLLLALALYLPGAPAQEPEHKFKDWASRCEKTKDRGSLCYIFQNLLLKTSKQRLLYVAIGYFGRKQAPMAVFTLPLGVSLPGGVSLKIDKRKKIRIRYERCDKSGCLAPLVLNDQHLKALQSGLKARVGFFDSSGREIAIPVSLLGFTAGFKSLQKLPQHN